MKQVIFDYSLKPSVVNEDNKNLNMSQLSLAKLKAVAKGNLFIFFEPQREYILLQTGLIDYLIQLKGVIKEIDSGNCKPFSVSSDWYSNSLDYLYDKNAGTLRIKEANDGSFEITVKYKRFKDSFNKFYQSTIRDLLYYYPDLKMNKNFTKTMTLV